MTNNVDNMAPEKPPKPGNGGGGGCCSKIATFLGLEPRAVAWFVVGPLRFELGVTLARRHSAARTSTEPTPPA